MSEILSEAERRDLLGMTPLGRAVLGNDPDPFKAWMNQAATNAGLDAEIDAALAQTELGRRTLALRKGKK